MSSVIRLPKKIFILVKQMVLSAIWRLFYRIGYLLKPFVLSFNRKVQIETLKHEGKHVFFGYYDLCPFNNDNSKILALIVNHPLKSPEPFSVAEIGFFSISQDKKTYHFKKLGETTAWCWQQGCRLQWYPKKGSCSQVFYNSFENGNYIGVIADAENGKVIRKIPHPLYDISENGEFGVTLDFSRLQRLRPGYGYNNISDQTIIDSIPENEGITLYNFKTGNSRLVIKYSDLLKLGRLPENNETSHHYLNHLSFNPSGRKFMFLHLIATPRNRISRLIVYDISSSKLEILNDYGKVSHYAWKDDNNLLAFCKSKESLKMSYMLYNLDSLSGSIETKSLKQDGHPTYFSNGKCLLIDTYPNLFGFLKVIEHNLESGKNLLNLFFHRSEFFKKECRVDLHPRISIDEKLICVDDETQGYRVMKLIGLQNEC